MYTGGRLNEIAQASVKDIKQIDGIWCISITDEAEHQKLKNANSARIIPIHQHLIDLGFIEYVQSRASKTLLFDDLLNSKAEVPRDGLGSNVGKWFNRFIKRLEIHNAVFHSFRHTVADEFKQNEVPETQAMDILGHKNQSITYARYAKDLNVATQQKTIQTLDFSNVIQNI
ncbi:site-specific integrase, partial [Psychromonas sp. Urea-02u-13]|uniref:site-specific integrase n=1 Tax=Psychromonas sp. Urea-02u-13 TaxID=2058326 RepID=UPI000CC43451